jgi:hypothetical protein
LLTTFESDFEIRLFFSKYLIFNTVNII